MGFQRWLGRCPRFQCPLAWGGRVSSSSFPPVDGGDVRGPACSGPGGECEAGEKLRGRPPFTAGERRRRSSGHFSRCDWRPVVGGRGWGDQGSLCGASVAEKDIPWKRPAATRGSLSGAYLSSPKPAWGALQEDIVIETGGYVNGPMGKNHMSRFHTDAGSWALVRFRRKVLDARGWRCEALRQGGPP